MYAEGDREIGRDSLYIRDEVDVRLARHAVYEREPIVLAQPLAGEIDTEIGRDMFPDGVDEGILRAGNSDGHVLVEVGLVQLKRAVDDFFNIVSRALALLFRADSAEYPVLTRLGEHLGDYITDLFIVLQIPGKTRGTVRHAFDGNDHAAVANVSFNNLHDFEGKGFYVWDDQYLVAKITDSNNAVVHRSVVLEDIVVDEVEVIAVDSEELALLLT